MAKAHEQQVSVRGQTKLNYQKRDESTLSPSLDPYLE